MPKNPFIEHQQYEPKPKRSNYDLSKRVNGTYKLGTIYPVGLWELNPGDSIHIKAAAGFRMFPMQFPIQTDIKMKYYWFWCPNRILWSNWKDFAFNNKQVTHPYIVAPTTNKEIFGVGQLGDHLGLPTNFIVTGATDGEEYQREVNVGGFMTVDEVSALVKPSDYTASTNKILPILCTNNVSGYNVVMQDLEITSANTQLAYNNGVKGFQFYVKKLPNVRAYEINYGNLITPANSDREVRSVLYYYDKQNRKFVPIMKCAPSYNGNNNHQPWQIYNNYLLDTSNEYWFNQRFVANDIVPSGMLEPYAIIQLLIDAGVCTADDFYIVAQCQHTMTTNVYNSYWPASGVQFLSGVYFMGFVMTLIQFQGQITDDNIVNPFGGEEPMIPINALPFRAYEAIYNSYFRNEITEPFTIAGEVQYNQFVTNLGDGADRTPYHLFQRNWESDVFTSAKPSPQQGNAPLVGITADGTITLQREDGGEYSVRVTTDNNGVIDGLQLATEKGQSDGSVRRTLLDLASSGISINDLRQVNGLQRWLEDNLRRGLRYRDQMLAQFGVTPRYNELDMPEYLGGFNVDINVQTLTQTSGATNDDNTLGDIRGVAAAYGKSGSSINKYADEQGFLMCVMCAVPVPVYSQNLPKYFMKSNPLDYFNPKFANIGMQPIINAEVAPIQAANEDASRLYDVFGYQRPWYDLISDVDSVHGQFRTTMRDFIMNRTFGGIPELGADFLHIDPAQLNDVFVVTDESEDTLYGQTYFDVNKSCGVPRFGIPRIEP